MQTVQTESRSMVPSEWGWEGSRERQAKGITKGYGKIIRGVNMFIFLIVLIIVIVSQVYTFIKFMELYTFNMWNLLYVVIPQKKKSC